MEQALTVLDSDDLKSEESLRSYLNWPGKGNLRNEIQE